MENERNNFHGFDQHTELLLYRTRDSQGTAGNKYPLLPQTLEIVQNTQKLSKKLLTIQ